jgi:hypothetical protein
VVYESRAGSNVGNTPASSPEQWLDTGATNKFRAFDSQIFLPATNEELIEYEITPSQLLSSVFLIAVQAASITVRMVDAGDGVVYEQTKNMVRTDNVLNIWDYFFLPIELAREAEFQDLPPYDGATIEISLSRPDDVVSVGEIVLGFDFEVGESLIGTEIGFRSLTRKERDVFGRINLIPRESIKVVKFNVSVDPRNYANLLTVLADVDKKLFVARSGRGLQMYGTTVFGINRDFSLPIQATEISAITVEVEEVI